MNAIASFDELFADHRIMVILRGLSTADTVTMSHTAWDAGVELLEVPIGEPGQIAALAAAADAGRARGKTVGAGTVVTPRHALDAASAGAAYTVAPGFDPDVLSASLSARLPHLPGVATATEIQRAYRSGLDWVKVFPAACATADWIRAMRGPFPHLNMVATGGITVDTAEQFLASGARVAALGSALSDPQSLPLLTELVSHTRA